MKIEPYPAQNLVNYKYTLTCDVGLNRTSRPVRKSGKSWNVRIPDIRFFSFPDSGPFNIEKNPKKKIVCLFIW